MASILRGGRISCKQLSLAYLSVQFTKLAYLHPHFTRSTLRPLPLTPTECGGTNFIGRMCSTMTGSQQQPQNSTEILAGLDAKDSRQLKVLQVEYDVWQSTGVRVPDIMTDDMWLRLLTECSSAAARRKMYNFWFKKEKYRQKQQQQRPERQKRHEERQQRTRETIEKGNHTHVNTFNLYIRESTIVKHYFNNLAYAMVNGPHLVFDFSFEKAMSPKNLNSMCNQIKHAYGANKVDSEPFHLHLTELQRNSKTSRSLLTHLPNLDIIPMGVTDASYLDFYPKDQLVYLSPNAKTTLEHYDPNDVYIIGGLNESVEEPLTYAKAKRQGIRSAKFPVDQFLRWKQGSKSLTLNQVVCIMLSLKKGEDWTVALQHVPCRKFQYY